MTNGEKIKAILKPRTNQIRIYSDWVEIEIQSLSINFSCELSWWNAEYKEPTTKNDTEMTIDAHIEVLKSYHNGFTGWASNIQDTIDVAIDTMRKYQKIVQIMERTVDDGTSMYDTLQEIEEVVEDGNVD